MIRFVSKTPLILETLTAEFKETRRATKCRGLFEPCYFFCGLVNTSRTIIYVSCFNIEAFPKYIWTGKHTHQIKSCGSHDGSKAA